MFISHVLFSSIWMTNPIQILQAQVRSQQQVVAFRQKARAENQSIVVGNLAAVTTGAQVSAPTSINTKASKKSV